MEIIDLTEKYYAKYFCCLEDWSPEMPDAGNHKEIWFHQMKDHGLRVKLAVKDEQACGMIQYLPVEKSFVDGQDLYVILCIWVHGYKQGIGNYQKKGIGAALLAAAEADVQAMHKKGIVAWGLALPFWMKASWFKKHGYEKVDKLGMSVLLWKPFTTDAVPPRWIREKKKPELISGKVTVSSFINGWCPAQNMIHERAKRAAQELGAAVAFQEISTTDRATLEEWGISDTVFIDGKPVRSGPPPTFEKIKHLVAKRVKKLAHR